MVPGVIVYIGILVLITTDFYPDQPVHTLTVSNMNPSMSGSYVFPLPYSASGTYCEYCRDTDEGRCEMPNLHNGTAACKWANGVRWGTDVGPGGQGAEETALSSAFDGGLPGIAVGDSTSVFNTSRYARSSLLLLPATALCMCTPYVMVTPTSALIYATP